MSKYVVKRILLIFLTAFIILSITYMLIQTLPLNEPTGNISQQITFWDEQVRLGFYKRVTDPAEIMNGLYDRVLTDGGTSHYYRAVPIFTRYLHWLRNIFTEWNWGVSTTVSRGQEAMQIILGNLPVTIKLNLVSICFSIPLGLGLGILAALKKNTWVDNTISTIVMIFISVPSFVLISFLLIWLSYSTGWLPSKWPTGSEVANNPMLGVTGYVIPVIALSSGSIAGFARYTRAELCEVMSSEFLLLARTKGLTRGQSVVRHALRNSMVPIIPMIIAEFISILSGSMVLEQIYGIPGVGQLFVKALTDTDYPVIMVDMAVYTLIGLAATLIIDLSYGVVDPRIRMGEAK